MERRNFFGNLIGFIGVVASAKQIASIGQKVDISKTIILPITLRTGDLVMSLKDNQVYYFTGSEVVNIKKFKDRYNVIRSNYPSKYFAIFSNAIGERTSL